MTDTTPQGAVLGSAPVPDASPSVSTFVQFKQACIEVLSQSQNCAESQAVFAATTNVSELAQAMRTYINGVLHEVPNQVIEHLAKYYDCYRDAIRSADVYYNEASPTGIVIVGNMPETFDGEQLIIESNAPTPVHVYVLGRASVVVRGHANLYCNNSDAIVMLRDYTHGTVVNGYAIARDRSRLTAYDRCECYGFSNVLVSDLSLIRDCGHRRLAKI